MKQTQSTAIRTSALADTRSRLAPYSEPHSTTEESHSGATAVKIHARISQALANTPAHTHGNDDVQHLPTAWHKTRSGTLQNKATASEEGNL